MKLLFASVLALVGVIASTDAHADTVPSAQEAFRVFQNVCLDSPLNVTANVAKARAQSDFVEKLYDSKGADNLLAAYQHSEKKLGIGVQAYRGGINCNVGFTGSGNAKTNMQEVANILAAQPKVKGPFASSSRKEMHFSYRGAPIRVKYKRRRVQIIISNGH